ncbi:TetR/AcrR family transcriptional regulator [Mycolicibacter hiberniae]|uniref:TetR family transcriptional regulator n=1 Tax=Mycolicibacter hiberniae TaxID=29314 RepID=A0A7I7X106_9MYCO|nr:TetR/AcrR family transcriptional regulator [Mycolicibacter hiberniae]MCV7086774.1 TetR/AcrR family transcriptional regulator [Mycolicibacter hiberniae]ORV70963.1 TetR family transcriptional regulator [Mycolicibacter hiberniae]BBZ21928.1 TetR family transcriptional regulator [Mycolicibacter hiberniae]
MATAPAAPVSTAAVQRRPKDRKAQIVRAAARTFSQRGYHAVGVDEIAAEVGISGPALYRHFANKYALLVATAEYAAQALVTAARSADEQGRPPAERLRAITAALIDATIGMRREGAFYRWERRYLQPPDRTEIRASYDALNAAIIEPLAQLRPGLAAADTAMLAAATLSVIGSISAHRTRLGAAALQDLLGELCWSVLTTELPPAPCGPAPRRPQRGLPSMSKRERLLAEAIRMFGQRGFYEVSIEEIATAAGLNGSSAYRYYPSKAALLAVAFHRASDRLLMAITDALAESSSPRQAALRIAERYTALAFAAPELVNIYFAEFANLPEADQAELRRLQRQNVDEWAHLVSQVGARETEALFRVHAALALVVDIGRLVNFDNRGEQRMRVQALMAAVLFGDGRGYAQDGALATIDR